MPSRTRSTTCVSRCRPIGHRGFPCLPPGGDRAARDRILQCDDRQRHAVARHVSRASTSAPTSRTRCHRRRCSSRCSTACSAPTQLATQPDARPQTELEQLIHGIPGDATRPGLADTGGGQRHAHPDDRESRLRRAGRQRRHVGPVAAKASDRGRAMLIRVNATSIPTHRSGTSITAAVTRRQLIGQGSWPAPARCSAAAS